MPAQDLKEIGAKLAHRLADAIRGNDPDEADRLRKSQVAIKMLKLVVDVQDLKLKPKPKT